MDFKSTLVCIVLGAYFIYFGRKAFRDPKAYIDRYRYWVRMMPSQSPWGRALIRVQGVIFGVWFGIFLILSSLDMAIRLHGPINNLREALVLAAITTSATIAALPKRNMPLPKLPPGATPPGTQKRATESLQSFRESQKNRRR